MNILFDLRPLAGENLTGIGFYGLNLLKNLLKTDKNNKYFLFIDNLRNTNILLKKHLIKWKKLDNVEVVVLDYPSKIFNFLLLFKFIKLDKFIAKKLNINFDLYIATNINYLNLSSDIKFILTVHDLSFFYFPEFLTFKEKIWHKLVKYEQLYQRADKIIAVSDNTKLDLESLGVEKDKIKTLKLPIDFEYFKNIDEEQANKIKKQYKLPNKYLLFLATLGARKNLSLVLESFVLLVDDYPDLKLVLAGSETKYSKKLLKKYEFLSDKIIKLGYFSENDKKYLYYWAEMLLYPSFYEGFGLPPLEALATDCPVIVGRNSALLENFAKYVSTVDVHNVAELKELICYTMNNKEAVLAKSQKIKWQEYSNKNYINNYLKYICE